MIAIVEPERNDNDDTEPIASIFDEYYVGNGQKSDNDVYCNDSVKDYERNVYQNNERFYNEIDR